MFVQAQPQAVTLREGLSQTVSEAPSSATATTSTPCRSSLAGALHRHVPSSLAVLRSQGGAGGAHCHVAALLEPLGNASATRLDSAMRALTSALSQLAASPDAMHAEVQARSHRLEGHLRVLAALLRFAPSSAWPSSAAADSLPLAKDFGAHEPRHGTAVPAASVEVQWAAEEALCALPQILATLEAPWPVLHAALLLAKVRT